MKFLIEQKQYQKQLINLNTGEILLVAGKGHEETQDLGAKKIFFSDKKVILNAIKVKEFNFIRQFKI